MNVCYFVFLPPQMNDMMLYTYPQQDGKYRLKNTLALSGMKVQHRCYGSVNDDRCVFKDCCR